MKKALFMLASLIVAGAFVGCSSNGLECNEKVFENHCVDAQTMEVCTYGERALVRCAEGTSCDEDDDSADCIPDDQIKKDKGNKKDKDDDDDENDDDEYNDDDENDDDGKKNDDDDDEEED